MDPLALVRGLTEDHPSSDDEAAARSPTKSPTGQQPTSQPPRGRQQSGTRAGPVDDPHDLIRGLTEDHWSSDEDLRKPAVPRAKALSTSRPRMSSNSRRPEIPALVGDPHALVRGITEDHPSSDEGDLTDGPPAAPPRQQRHPSTAASEKKLAPGVSGDPHDLLRGLTEDHWSDNEGKASKAAAILKKPPIRHRLSSASARAEKPAGDPHDLIRGMTEDVWSSDEDTAVRQMSTGSTSAKLATATSPRSKSMTSPAKLLVGPKQSLVPGVPHQRKPSGGSANRMSPNMTSPAWGAPPRDRTPIRVLFICLGNICRSPMAHGVLQYLTRPGALPAHLPPVRVDSAGTGAYHALSPPDARTMELLRLHGIKSFVHSARKIRNQDFWDWDYLLCMDAENLTDLKRKRKGIVDKLGKDVAADQSGAKDRREPRARIQLFGEYGGNQTEIVEDPYYGSNEGFDVAWEQVVRMCRGWIQEVLGVEADTGELEGVV